MPDFGEQCWPTDFIPKIAERIVSGVSSGLTRDRVFASGLDDQDLIDLPPGGADQFISLWMPSLLVDQRQVTGGGNINTPLDSTLVTKLFVRFEGDIETRSTEWLNNTVFGPLALAKKVVTALQTWEGPVGASGLHLFRWPMRLGPGIQITRGRGKVKAESRWGIVAISWIVSFVAALGNNYPGS